jgi:alpha/beta superfamily hydrolase
MVHPWGILGGSAANVEPFAEILASKYGIISLTFDLRGVGQSQGSATYRCRDEINDVLGACAFIRSKFNKPVRIVIVSTSLRHNV